jgi:hypothetical protein
MSDAQLRQRLAELHTELERGPDIDDESRRLLEALTSDIRRVLDREERADDEAPLTEQLTEGVRRFEESHPELAAALNRIANALSNLGI